MPPSVAPPIAARTQPGAIPAIRSPSPGSIQSPEHRQARSGSRSSGPAAAQSISARAGAEFQMVTRCSATSRNQAKASRRSSSSMQTRAPPVDSGPKMSKTLRSKSSDETPRTRSRGPSASRPATSWTVLAAAAWLMSTPLGSPVEPEV